MILFLTVLVVAVWITKVFWGKSAAIGLSILNAIMAVMIIPIMMNESYREAFYIGFIFSVAYVAGFLFLNVCWLIGAFLFSGSSKKTETTESSPLKDEIERAVQKYLDDHPEYYDDDDDDDYESDDEEEDDEEEYGKYIIQYRNGYGGWIDGPGTNDERIAERMFDNFVSKEMLHRNATRARLVKKNNSGRVISILGTS